MTKMFFLSMGLIIQNISHEDFMTYEQLCDKLLEDLKDNKDVTKIFKYKYNELERHFLGFIEQYYHLSKVIPKHFTVIDLGCYAGLQAWYFKDHKKYIGVDTATVPKLNLDNTEYHTADIDEWILKNRKFDNEQEFAICNYVPIDTNLVRKTFKNLFVYYPSNFYKTNL